MSLASGWVACSRCCSNSCFTACARRVSMVASMRLCSVSMRQPPGSNESSSKNPPALFVALAQRLDPLEVLRVDMDTDVRRAHRQQLQSLAQDLADMAGVHVQFALDHLAGNVVDQVDHALLDQGVLLGDGFQKLRHQTLETLQTLLQRLLGFLPRLQLAGVETVALAGGEAFVVGVLADRLDLLQRRRLDGLQLDLFHRRRRRRGFDDRGHLRRGNGRLVARLVEARQRPEAEGRHVLAADQFAGIVFVLVVGDHLRSSPRHPCRPARYRRTRPCAGQW